MNRHPNAVAATQPMALAALAEHMTRHALPAAHEVAVPGAFVGDSETPAVRIVLDARSVNTWIDSLEQLDDLSTSAMAGGTWYERRGVANTIRVRLQWFISGPDPDTLARRWNDEDDEGES